MKNSILKLLVAFKQLKFIQVGAYDGIAGDPLHNYILKNKCKGILIEPISSIFDLLIKNYEGVEGEFIFENIAIHSKLKETKIYIDKKDMSCSSIYKTRNITRHGSTKIVCLSTTLNDIINKHKFYDIDLLQMDIEGGELEAIMSIDLSTHCPKIINFENKHLKKLKLYKKFARILLSNNYSIKEDGSNDTTAILKK